MKWENIQNLNDKKFQRRTGVKRPTFLKMIETVKSNFSGRGRPPKLSIEDQTLVMLMYYREYRTMENIGLDFEMSEAQTCRIINKIENILTKDKQFQLPGKREIETKSFDTILIDVTESPIQRPKKNKKIGILERKKAIE